MTQDANNGSEYRQRIKHTTEKADKYQHRKANKHKKEMALIERALGEITGVKTFLDAPCGVGRASLLLEQKGYTVTGVDLGEGALKAAQETVEAVGSKVKIEKADLEQIPYEDKSFDACLCFRFIHHLSTAELRDRIIGQLCRVSDRYVLISYLSPMSVTSFRRSMKEKLQKKISYQNRIALSHLQKHFSDHGFSLKQDYAQLPLLHSLHLAVFERNS
ncbi:Methyltransferase domain-containing protein [Malonomonas rubra DSM 5091]|uniref:Methyltransferase domain-containing protein n=1 Tax=Malonomonas rubra DSM 5091 TaxID=1122189 RepID=A0A1M6C6V9_MALRU|nr:class I SAM-dependent methyltransferase [Malonomonas rubra]SHI56787.1 Methyltransferase domain-containing protein [Malonomonas rubra DSM 5091]